MYNGRVEYVAAAGVMLLIAVIALIFISGNRAMAEAHVQFTAADVEQALAEVTSPDSSGHEAWDLFLAWPIRDQYLESIRRRCLAIIKNDDPPPGRDLSYGAEREVKALLKELRERASPRA